MHVIDLYYQLHSVCPPGLDLCGCTSFLMNSEEGETESEPNDDQFTKWRTTSPQEQLLITHASGIGVEPTYSLRRPPIGERLVGVVTMQKFHKV